MNNFAQSPGVAACVLTADATQEGMIRIWKTILASSLAVFIGGCVATGPAFVDAPSPKDGDVLVYIYRPSTITMAARTSSFYLDDVNVADLNSGGYTWFHLPTGEYSLKQKWSFGIGLDDLVIPVKWNVPKKVFYRFTVSASGYPTTTFRWRLTEVPETAAMAEIRECSLQQAFGIQKLIEQPGRKKLVVDSSLEQPSL